MLYRFAHCQLDDSRHVFRVDGTDRPLEPQVFDLLLLLVRQPGVLISRDALVDAVWGGRIVSEATIAARINAARRAVGDDGKAQRIIRTVPRRGIQLVCPVEKEGETAAPPRTDERQIVRYVRSPDGVPLAFATTGHGAPLMRGSQWLTHLELDWASPIWRPLLDELGRDFAITRWDQRGTGLSGRDAERLDIEAMVGDLEAVADAAGLDRFPIFAASQAVPVAVSFAARHPERISKLVLYGGYVTGRTVREGPEAHAEHAAFLTLTRAGWGRPDSAFIRAFTTIYMPDATPEQLDSFVEMQLASASPDTAARLREATGRYDVRPVIAEVRAPSSWCWRAATTSRCRRTPPGASWWRRREHFSPGRPHPVRVIGLWSTLSTAEGRAPDLGGGDGAAMEAEA
jgi:DNA-binding winged helix-turn-helix (wHTH) protein